jgi:hypothetical protein
MRAQYTISDSLAEELRRKAKAIGIPVSLLVAVYLTRGLRSRDPIVLDADGQVPASDLKESSPTPHSFPPISDEEAREMGYDPTLSQK